MFKKLILPLALSLLALLATASFAAESSKLPEINGWKNGALRTTELDAISGHKGSWLERSYRTTDGAPFRAVWVDGAATEGWNISEPSNDKGEIWGGETSEKITVAKKSAILEYRPVIGYSLILKTDGGVLTLESQVATAETLINAAEILIKNKK